MFNDFLTEFNEQMKGIVNNNFLENYIFDESGGYKLLIQFINTSRNIDPEFKYDDDSGFDLRSSNEEEIILQPQETKLIPTGLYFAIPSGFEMQIRPRSGLALKHGITVLNSPGTVDCFSKDMKILTPDGEKNFINLDVGDIVFSFNEETNEFEKDIISKKFNKGELDILIIETENGVLEITNNTPVLTKRGWVLGKELSEVDEILVF